jgi:hypothetical protein
MDEVHADTDKGGTEPSIDYKSNTTNWFFTLLTTETGLLMADL